MVKNPDKIYFLKGFFMVTGTVKNSIITRLMTEQERQEADDRRHYINIDFQPVMENSVQLQLGDVGLIPYENDSLSETEQFGLDSILRTTDANGTEISAFTARYHLECPAIYRYDSMRDEYRIDNAAFEPKVGDEVVVSCAHIDGPNGDFYRLDKVFLIDDRIHFDALKRAYDENLFAKKQAS